MRRKRHLRQPGKRSSGELLPLERGYLDHQSRYHSPCTKDISNATAEEFPSGMGAPSLSPSSSRHPLGCCNFGSGLIAWIHTVVDAVAVVPWNRHPAEESLLPASHLDQRGIGQTQQHRALLWTRFPLLSPPTSASPWLVSHRPAGRFDLHRHHHCRGFLPSLPGVLI